ncbi:MAG: SRPBCC family protein [Gammaproteobacteria bacterium]|nr:SRPBCC family protein [Gammaproteobacteria bacterium]
MKNLFPILLVLCSFVASAAEIRKLEVTKTGGVYFVDSISYIDAPISNVYEVLVDYENLNRLTSAIVESHFVEPAEDGTPQVYTLTRKCVFLFCGKIEKVDRLTMEPVHKISTVTVPEQSNIDYGISEWLLSEEGDGTVISYRQELDPAFWVPPLIGPMIIKRMMRKGGRRAIFRVEYYARIAAGLSAEEPPAIKRKRRRQAQ